MIKSKWILAAAATALVWTSMAGVEAAARERKWQGSAQGQRGGATGSGSVQRSQGHRHKESTWTGSGGRTTSVTDDRAVDKEAGTYSHDRTRTFNDGSTRTVDGDVQKTGDGTYSATRTVTGRDGETRTQTGDFAVTKTEDGRQVDGTIQTQNHGTVDYSKTVAKDGEGGRTVSSSASFEDGTSMSRNSASSCVQGQGCSSSTALTGRQGQTTQIDQSRQKTETGWTKDRTTTFSDGTTRQTGVTGTKTGEGSGTVDRTITRRDGSTSTQTGTVSVQTTP